MSFSLDDLRAEIEREYAPLVIQAGGHEYRLTPLLRTDRKVREAVLERLTSLQKAHDDDEETVLDEDAALENVSLVLQAVTEDGQGPRLIEQLDGDLLLSMKLLEKWTERTQPGEAKDSPTS